jgi:hypothetical protein
MTFELVAILIAGFGGAGVGLFLTRVLKLPLPRWFAPVLAGLCMIAMSIWSEYNWFPRLKAGIPPGVVLADTGATASPLRPWTYAFPLVTEAFLVDTRRWDRNPQAPDLVLAQVFRFARWQGNQEMLVMFDCAKAQRVDVTANVTFSETGEMSGGTWVPLDPADPILKAACHGG